MLFKIILKLFVIWIIGGGSQRLFRKIGSRSSVYSSESGVRKTGSYIYEDFMPTDGTDVKVRWQINGIILIW